MQIQIKIKNTLNNIIIMNKTKIFSQYECFTLINILFYTYKEH